MYYVLNVELFLSHQLVAYEEHIRFYVMDAQLFLRLQHYLTGNQDVVQPLSLSLTQSLNDTKFAIHIYIYIYIYIYSRQANVADSTVVS
jgi:hypothetical protein